MLCVFHMIDKTAPIGTCDHCGGPIPPGEWYTRRGPRRYCCIDCKNTANSRNGNPARVAKLHEAVADGRWVNPRANMTTEEISALQSESSRKGRLREVAEGRWRNPGLSDEARAINRAKQAERYSDPSVREAVRQRSLSRTLTDARSNRIQFTLRADLWPTHCNAAHCRMEGSRVVITPVRYEFTETERTMPRRNNNLPYTALRCGVRRIAIECRAWLNHAPGAWRCVERGERLVFEFEPG